ncbi:MAG: helix-turn-helix transcriptional regulator [Clostridiales bacterium]|nr:helix-turn-helix transcriptional regulator [Clostridiales bacterium]
MIKFEKIQKKLSEAIKQSGKSQSEIARQIGVKPQQVSAYVLGKQMPAVDNLAKLCAVLDLDANDLLCVEDYYKEN